MRIYRFVGINYLVNYCACAIMQVSSRGGRDKPKEDNNQKWRTNNMNKLRQTAVGGVNF